MKSEQSLIVILALGLVGGVIAFFLGKKESDDYKLPEVELQEHQNRKRRIGFSVFMTISVLFVVMMIIRHKKSK